MNSKCVICGYEYNGDELTEKERINEIKVYSIKLPEQLRNAIIILIDKLIESQNINISQQHKTWVTLYSYYKNTNDISCILDGINKFIKDNNYKNQSKKIEYLLAIIRNIHNSGYMKYEEEQKYLDNTPPEDSGYNS